ncbi:PTS sugar transporter subunit IIC [Serpentinicella sp. ANB-PHB4]|uniref:PTS transporter subunit IIC n=1 Tax=Serpentinicella sp. ANB-PHB4 TaxID=3074076 RepID=UPI0028565560|nr:PTS sugar transporter subunit IIC [Serpentinicella sp. ANB-PHB4]MDR5659103.1 PTS sugar transporter subunit IIC [Serpentinicella sp. ANB-PHB4]
MSEKKVFSIREYLTKALNGMALGLFSSLIIGLIIKQVGELLNIPTLILFGTIAQYLMGPAIGAGVAYTVGAPSLGIFASLATGAIGANVFSMTDAGVLTFSGGFGEPVGAFIAALIGAEAAKLIAGKTKVDIVLIPSVTIIAGGLAGLFVGPGIAAFMAWVGSAINTATVLHPFPMGIIIAVSMGMILTLPISSAAIAISLGLDGLAAGAAVVGCATQMVGFAVASYKENGFGGLIAQGLGTSMLQVPNLIKNPKIWLPPIIASAIIGPIATTIFMMESNSIGAGMGTSGLVGQFGTFAKMVTENGQSATVVLIYIGILHFVLPAVLTFFISQWMRKKQWIKDGDMKLD